MVTLIVFTQEDSAKGSQRVKKIAPYPVTLRGVGILRKIRLTQKNIQAGCYPHCVITFIVITAS